MGLPPSAVRHREIAFENDCADTKTCNTGIAWVRRTLTDWDLLGQGQDAVLIAAELLSNAAKHGGGILSLALDWHGHLLRIAVTDPSPDPPRLREHRPDATGGHGVFLVDVLAQQWGSESHGPGKTVWADVRLPY
ncbi:ATP-binding protein [Streptomyces sp. NPDC004244]|uniref:ATP-binding protein n=1 Tax=Streptomyces sp. NPDC101206 TaxID=3366128 RepID=UPI00381FEC29